MAAQEWLLRRLQGLRPFHFEESSSVANTSGVCLIGCSRELEAPRAFRRVWSQFEGGDGAAFSMTAQQLSAATALLIFSNPFLPEQVRATSELVSAIDAFGANAPPMFWLPHTVSPEARPREQVIRALDNDLLRVLEMGLDGIVADEPEGMRLALQVRMKIRKSDYMSQTLNNIINTRRAHAMQGSNLKDQIHSIIWEYLCVRMAPSIPPCNHNLPFNRPTEIAGMAVGRELMRSTFFTTFVLASRGAPDEVKEVVKVMDKDKNSKVQAIKRTKSAVDVMLLVSKAEWQHPNLVKLHEIYHSRTHLMFRMEYSGSENLFERLRGRDKPVGEQVQPLPLEKTRSIILQLLSVVSHLHTGPGICHRDLKPENFSLIETPDAVTVKLLDLDLAVILGQQLTCKTACGTIPLVAPEVLLVREYNGRAADTWSLAMSLLEVLCFVKVMECLLEVCTRSSAPNPHVGREIAKCMARAGRVEGLLQERCREELRPLQEPLWPALRGMLAVDVPLRWRSDQAHSHVLAAFESQGVAEGLMG